MVRVLIPTHVHDVHATTVARALEIKGHEAVLIYGGDYPSLQQASLSIGQRDLGTDLSWEVSGSEIDLADHPFDVVWYRRPSAPVLPNDMHPGDRLIADRECISFIKSFWQLIAPDAFWINPFHSRDRSLSKPIQLLEAHRSGLAIPPTLCSNDPEKIRTFLRKHEGRTIYKSYAPAHWRMDGGVAMSFTSNVTVDDLPDDDVLRLSPGIFQRRIEKDHELRVTYMGDFAIAAKLCSQENENTRTDWRESVLDVPLVPTRLPESVDLACRRLMKRLGIVFGCFDLIVTPEGEYVFLEVNEMGQFLWLEEFNPEIRMLEPFCQFLIEGRLAPDWKPGADALRFEDFRNDEVAKAREEEEPRLHVNRPNHHSVPDNLEQVVAAGGVPH